MRSCSSPSLPLLLTTLLAVVGGCSSPTDSPPVIAGLEPADAASDGSSSSPDSNAAGSAGQAAAGPGAGGAGTGALTGSARTVAPLSALEERRLMAGIDAASDDLSDNASTSQSGPVPVADPVAGPTGISALAWSPGVLWIGSPSGLSRFQISSRTLEPVYLPLKEVAPAVAALTVDRRTLYLKLADPGQSRGFLRFELRDGAVTSIPWEQPAGPWWVDEDGMWFAEDRAGGLVGRVNPVLGSVMPFPRPARAPSGAPVALSARGGHALLGTKDGGLLRIDAENSHWQTLLVGGARGAGAILGAAPWRDGFAVATARGLLYFPLEGQPQVIDAAARLEHLTADGPDLWGIENGALVRFNARLSRRVVYSSSQPLEGVHGLVAGADGVWVASQAGVYQLDLSAGALVLVVNAVTGAAAADEPSEAEIEDLLRQLSAMTPPDKRIAYQKLLPRTTGSGYDEVFLVGLNEDDPLTIEVVAQYFRTHHPLRAIEPMLDVLLFIQGDVALRDQLAAVLETFGPMAVGPVASRLTHEKPEVLAGGAGRALEQVLVGAIDRGGVGTLNQFLIEARPDWLLAYGSADPPRDTVPQLNASTFRILARRLAVQGDERVTEGALRVINRLARRPNLPPSVSELVPLLMGELNGPQRRWALYGLTLLGDARATQRCAEVVRLDPAHRFWAIQALGATGDARGFSTLVKALKDEKPEVREAAAFLIRGELVREGAPVLRQMLADETEGLCSSCVEALTVLRDREARSVLEARLPRARREDQADLLRALLTMSDPALARQIQGWVELEILAPARVGRLSLEPGPSQQVLDAALTLLAVDGGQEGQAFIRRVQKELSGEAGKGALEALRLSEALPAGLSRVLRQAVLGGSGGGGAVGERPSVGGKTASSTWRGVPFVSPTVPAATSGATASGEASSGSASAEALLALREIHADNFTRLRSLLFLLVPRKADPGTREVLEDILLQARSTSDREEAARALFNLADKASIPALTRALQDPYFQNGPFPLYGHPVRQLAARALDRLGVKVVKRADRSYGVM